MEFNIDTDKVVGIVGYDFAGGCVRIKILSIIDSHKKIMDLTEKQSIELFPPEGFIFEPGFFHNNEFHEKDVISFFAIENEHAEPGKDQFRINERKQINFYGVQARHIIGFSRHKNTVDLSSVSIPKKENQSDGDFYGITDKCIVGKLRVHNNLISPVLYHRIKIWDIEEKNILKYDGIVRLHKDPDPDPDKSRSLDCMSDERLFEWFRDELKKVDPDYVDLLDQKAEWRTRIPELFSEADEERREVDEFRFDRIEDKFKLLALSSSDIKNLIEKSNSLREVFNKAIETYKEEWKRDHVRPLEEYRKEFDKQKKILDSELEGMQNSQKEKETLLDSLNKKIERLNQNKERILADFLIIKEVLSIESNTGKPIAKQSDSFVLENIDTIAGIPLFVLRNNFILELQYQLNKYQLYPSFAKRLLDVISIYTGVFIKDVKLGIAFINATNNTKYIIQQVEPDWLHFSDFWDNGLGAIWQSAHKYPEKLHFLILEDINLSSPECYARPLFDMINGVRNHIPYGKTVYPKNLKILATKASTAEPEIGLPLIAQTFTGWGAVGFNDKIYEKDDKKYKSLSGFITSDMLSDFQLDNFDIEDVKLAVKQELSDLFGEE